MRRRFLSWSGLVIAIGAVTAAPATAQRTTAPVSAPIGKVRYEITFDSSTARSRTIKVAMSFDVAGPGPVLLSLPAWTPGAYELSFFARWVSNFNPRGAGQALAWDKLDYDTWRLLPAGARSVTVHFDYLADSLDNAMAWSRPDFALFNGTNVLLYPEGRGTDFPATVTIKTEPGWLIATGMQAVPQRAGTYQEGNYHDLVDKPFFVGRMDYDSTRVAGVWTRLATYPAGSLTGPTRAQTWDQIGKMIPAEAAVFRETPWPHYTVMMIFDSSYGGGSALEHTNSHVGIYSPQFIGNPILASITAHEIFHAWNVKRLRPADMVPYRYDRSEPTPWLWVSEGITDYYADLAILRGGIIDSAQFLGLTGEKIGKLSEAPPTALEDASLSTWIHPTDGSSYLYYPKGSLAGLLLDVLIRDASDNRHSLDDVMRELYRSTYKAGRGFTGVDWWRAVSRNAAGKSFKDFAARYVDGRVPYPWTQVLPLAGLREVADTVREARLGIATAMDSTGGIVIKQVDPGSAAGDAGVKPDDVLLRLGGIAVTDSTFGEQFRERFGKDEGQPLPIEVRRDGRTMTLNGEVRLVTRVENRLTIDPTATAKAVRIREGIFRGTTGQ
ncbi:MAG TPA: PDZ domain-containing protein [Gemmatimonadales bacterium]|nr:PDZ domain-containing protein [Gemmatimonadales bacterium]